MKIKNWKKSLNIHGVKISAAVSEFAAREKFIVVCEDASGAALNVDVLTPVATATEKDILRSIKKTLKASAFKVCKNCKKKTFAYRVIINFNNTGTSYCSYCEGQVLAKLRAEFHEKAKQEPEISSDYDDAQAKEHLKQLKKLGYKPGRAKELSTANLSKWPSASELKKLCMSLAVIDACDGVDLYSFEMYSNLDEFNWNGTSGDTCRIFFVKNQALVLGFDHESPMSTWADDLSKNFENGHWRGLFNGLPAAFKGRFFKDYIEDEDVSFCVWFDGKSWKKGVKKFLKGKDPDGSEFVMSHLPSDPMTHTLYMSYMCSRWIDHSAVEKIYQFQPLSNELIRAINPNCKLKATDKIFKKIGYR